MGRWVGWRMTRRLSRSPLISSRFVTLIGVMNNSITAVVVSGR